MLMKMSKIISGSPLRPVAVGEPVLICKKDSLMWTTPVMGVEPISPSEIRFETMNSKYVLKVKPVGTREVG